MNVIDALKNLGFSTISPDWYSLIDTWKKFKVKSSKFNYALDL